MVFDGPALHPQQGTRGCVGVWPTGPHVFCGSGKGIQPCPWGNLRGCDKSVTSYLFHVSWFTLLRCLHKQMSQ